MLTREAIKARVQGHSHSHLYFNPGMCRCGVIHNGVSLELGDSERGREGGWVISFRDLEKMYVAARKARQ